MQGIKQKKLNTFNVRPSQAKTHKLSSAKGGISKVGSGNVSHVNLANPEQIAGPNPNQNGQNLRLS